MASSTTTSPTRYASTTAQQIPLSALPFLLCARQDSNPAVERAFGDLKTSYGLAPLRMRGLAKVQLHADLTMLARLSQALARARAVPLAA